MAEIETGDVLRPAGTWRFKSVRKTDTPDGKPCECNAVFEFDVEDGSKRVAKLALNPGNLGDDFVTLWDEIPDVPQSVLDAAKDKCPKDVLKQAWRAAR